MSEDNKSIVILRVRGVTGLNPKKSDTMRMLNIPRQNQASIVTNTASNIGMLNECKDYITWGPVSSNVLEKLIEKKATQEGRKLETKTNDAKRIVTEILAGKTLKQIGIDRTFRLKPPKKGWKNRKKRYPQGDLGPRDSIDSMILKMI